MARIVIKVSIRLRQSAEAFGINLAEAAFRSHTRKIAGSLGNTNSISNGIQQL